MLQIFKLEVHLRTGHAAVERGVLQIRFPDIGPYDFFGRNHFFGNAH
jgi:hypothetical protein